MNRLRSLTQPKLRNNDIATARMNKDMDDLEHETTDMLERAKVERNDIDKITLEIKKIEEIIDNKIVSKRIKLWNSKPQKAISVAMRPTASSLARVEATHIAATSMYASRMPASRMPASSMYASRMPASRMPASRMPASRTYASRMPASRMPASRMALIPEVNWHTRWVQRSANRNKKHPGEESELKNEITSTLIQSERETNDIMKSQDTLKELITSRIARLREQLDGNLLDEYTRYAGPQGIVKEYFLDHPIFGDWIKKQRDDLKTTETYKTRLINFKKKLEQLVPKSITQDTSPEQDTVRERLSKEFTRLYEKYKNTTTNPKEIPKYFNCPISLEPIMFPLSRKDKNDNVFTYESNEISIVIKDGGNDPLTRAPIKSTDDYMPDPIFDSLLDEFIIDPEAYYENYDTINYKPAHLQEEHGLTKDEATMYLKNAHLQKDRGLTKNELITYSAGKRKTKQRKQKNKTYKSYKKNKQTNKRRKVKKYKFKYTKQQRTKNKKQKLKYI